MCPLGYVHVQQQQQQQQLARQLETLPYLSIARVIAAYVADSRCSKRVYNYF